MQHEEDALSCRMIKKIDKVVAVQKVVTEMVDNIGLHIDGFDTVDVEGADATMMLQKHIISAG